MFEKFRCHDGDERFCFEKFRCRDGAETLCSRSFVVVYKSNNFISLLSLGIFCGYWQYRAIKTGSNAMLSLPQDPRKERLALEPNLPCYRSYQQSYFGRHIRVSFFWF